MKIKTIKEPDFQITNKMTEPKYTIQSLIPEIISDTDRLFKMETIHKFLDINNELHVMGYCLEVF